MESLSQDYFQWHTISWVPVKKVVIQANSPPSRQNQNYHELCSLKKYGTEKKVRCISVPGIQEKLWSKTSLIRGLLLIAVIVLWKLSLTHTGNTQAENLLLMNLFLVVRQHLTQ